MLKINFNLLMFILKTFQFQNPNIRSDDELINFLGEATYYRFDKIISLIEEAKKNKLDYINIDNLLLNDLIIIYYGNEKNKSLEDIKNDFIIKSLLE